MTTEKDAVRLEPLAPLPFDAGDADERSSLEGWDDLAALLDAGHRSSPGGGVRHRLEYGVCRA